ncbi:hypothetical protein AB0J83_31060 [Actinoplanes sp. NPDC049596]|uniref:hypothetical protein n=1 Tax=unclassified Actinoplanes TaxID=2626549 RepID=UPI00341EDBB1
MEAALAARAALLSAFDDGRGPIAAETFYGVLLPGAERRVREARLERDRWSLSQRRPTILPKNPRAEWDDHDGLGWRQEFLADHIVSVIVKPASRGNQFCTGDYDIIWRTD